MTIKTSSNNLYLELEYKKFLEWEEYNWMQIENSIKMIPNDSNISLVFIDIILYFLAKDHESERIMEILEEKPTLGYVIARKGVNYQDWNARWQVAVLLAHFKDTKLLIKMVEKDEEEYVRRRALLGLRDIDNMSAEKLAIKHLKSIYEYERMVAIDTLDFLSSSYLTQALNMLKDDPSTLIQNKIKGITLYEAENIKKP